MRIFQIFSLLVFFWTERLLVVVEASPGLEVAEALVQWFHTKGGKVHDHVEFRQVHGMYGLFARDKISKGEVLVEIPQSCLLKPDDGHLYDRVRVLWDDGKYYGGYISALQKKEDGTLLYDISFDDHTFEYGVERSFFEFEVLPTQCATVRKLAEEMELGEKSEFSAYVDYLMGQSEGQLPSAWSEEGQELLKYVTGGLPPKPGFVGWLHTDWLGVCRGDPKYLQVAALVNQRSWDEVMIPVYDMMQHRNGKWLNTDSDPIREGSSVKVRAKRDIEAGEELYTSYNHCIDCVQRYEDYGTPELLRDYGFVEDFPQRWYFPLPKAPLSFDLDLDKNLHVQLTFIKEPPKEAVPWLKKKLRRLKDVGELALEEDQDETIPEHEMETIMKWYEAATVALTKAIEALKSDDKAPTEEADCAADGTCDAVSDQYGALELKKEGWAESRPGLCDYHGIYKLNSWVSEEKVQSHYQKIDFLTIPTHDDNMCFDLDGTVQICECYRPQYHEMAVHYSAKFIQNMQGARTLFVGGGDSMLLHEYLKYSVDKIVGLELDQQVTRGCFKYFGTQPHWDNEKVEWWFGDATKSLLILPKEYFGSFDIVIVDLSETVMALTVTKELDVMQALTLLLKPDGVMVKNEIMYFPEMSDIFPYSMHIHFYDVPIVCTQSLVLGSPNVDFLRSPSYDHNVKALYRLVGEDQYKVVHDFQHNNETVKSYCRNETSLAGPVTQEKSPGILMIVEAEGTTISKRGKLKEAISKALSVHGISVVESRSLKSDDSSETLLFIFTEGYIVAHAWSEFHYCGFDIHFWSNFDKQDTIKRGLVEAVGSKTDGGSSAYRIVAGGMFNTKNWREEQKTIGPLAALPMCEKKDEDTASTGQSSSKSEEPMLNLVLKESLNLLSKDRCVAVVCGSSLEACDGVKMVEAAGIEAIPLVCPGISDSVAFEEDGLDKMSTCEHELHHVLNKLGKKIDTLILDSSTIYPMAQILNEMFTVARNAHRWLNKDIITAISVLPANDGSWRNAFVDMIRTSVVVHEPVFRSEVQYNNSFGLAVTEAGNPDFLPNLIRVVESTEKVTGCTGSIENLRGGQLVYQDDFDPDQFFTHKDYDTQDAKKQWLSQKALGFQTVLQYEGKVSDCNELLKFCEKAFMEMGVKGRTDESFKDVGGDGCVILSYWSKGSTVILWDGRSHVDANLYLYVEDWDLADEFSDELEAASGLKLSLRDVQPRGPGRVVNFAHDLEDDYTPAWTKG